MTDAAPPDAAPPDALAALVADSGLDATGRPGEAATSVEYRVQAERTVDLLATTLARLHATPVPTSEAGAVLDAADIAARASRWLESGQLEGRVRSAAYGHLDDARLVAVLRDGVAEVQRRASTPVLTHGAAGFERLWADRGQAVGLVGWHDAALADPYRDLAVAARSIAEWFTPVLVPVLFERYGEPAPDPVRLDWYALATELQPPAPDEGPGTAQRGSAGP